MIEIKDVEGDIDDDAVLHSIEYAYGGNYPLPEPNVVQLSTNSRQARGLFQPAEEERFEDDWGFTAKKSKDKKHTGTKGFHCLTRVTTARAEADHAFEPVSRLKSSMMAPLPKALVLQWSGTSIRVRCPYCLSTHNHSYPLEDSRQRQSDCHDVGGGEYQMAFPGEGDAAAVGCGWELDRHNFVFVTVDATGRLLKSTSHQPYRSFLPSFAHLHERKIIDEMDDEDGENDVNARLSSAIKYLSLELHDTRGPPPTPPPPSPLPPPRTDEEVWAELYACPSFRRDMYFSACTRRDVPELQHLFKTYPGDQFSSQVNDCGDNGVLCAATEENGLATLEWLHRRGALIDQSNHYGRKPLMEAALWGRLKTVQYLIGHGVNVRARDANGMDALELATDAKRNQDERASRAGLVYREPGNANEQRRRIENHLRLILNVPSPSCAVENSHRGLSFFQRTEHGNFVLIRPQSLLLIPNGQNQKALAELDRGPKYPLINAMSGYTQPGWPNVLDNTDWARKADDLNHYLRRPRNLSYASHVEVQLLTYLLFHHSLVSFLIQDGEFERRNLESLAPCVLSTTLTPIITVNKEDFCTSCLQFFNDFKAAFPFIGVQFHFVGENVSGGIRVRS